MSDRFASSRSAASSEWPTTTRGRPTALRKTSSGSTVPRTMRRGALWGLLSEQSARQRVVEASEILGIDRKTLYSKAKNGIQID